MRALLIVETPAKARAIAALLGDDYVVEPSLGFVRDMPRRNEDIPHALRADPWARLGVNVEDDFRPLYVVPDEAAAHVARLAARLAEVDALVLATQPLASQMAAARGETVSVHIAGRAAGKRVELVASGRAVAHSGYLEGEDLGAPECAVGARLTPLSVEVEPDGAPARFTDGSLVRELDELGVGRPATFAPLIARLVEHGLAWRKGTELVPSFDGLAVARLFERHFPELVDPAVAASVEEALDAIGPGGEQRAPLLRRLHLAPHPASVCDLGLQRILRERPRDIDRAELTTMRLGADERGVEVVLRLGRLGPRLHRGDQVARLPENQTPAELTLERALEILAEPQWRVPG